MPIYPSPSAGGNTDKNGAIGYFRRYKTLDSQEGAIYVCSTTEGVCAKAYEVHGPVFEKYLSAGGPAVLGFPVTDDLAAPGGGHYNDFQNGSIYASPDPSVGTHFVKTLIRDKWLSLGGFLGVLGFPVTDEKDAPGGGRYNDFQNGSIYWTSAGGAHRINGSIRDKWLSLGGAGGSLGYLMTNEAEIPGGWYNEFQNGLIYASPDPSVGTHFVKGSILGKWLSLGGAGGFLGYPTSDEAAIPGGWYNDFQNGSIYTSSVGTHEVEGDIRTKWLSLGGPRSFLGYLGYPTTDELDAANFGRYSDFEHGSIYASTLGVYEVNGDIRTKWLSLGGAGGTLGYPINDAYFPDQHWPWRQDFERGYISKDQDSTSAYAHCNNPIIPGCDNYVPPSGGGGGGELEATVLFLLQSQPVWEGNLPYTGTFGYGTNGHLTKIELPSGLSNVILMLVKGGHDTSECNDPDAVVILRPGQSTTSDDMASIYGIPAPPLPVPIVACVAKDPPLPVLDSVPVLLSYKYVPSRNIINPVSGDINADGLINAADLARLDAAIAGTSPLSAEDFVRADVVGPCGITSVRKLKKIRKAIAGFIKATDKYNNLIKQGKKAHPVAMKDQCHTDKMIGQPMSSSFEVHESLASQAEEKGLRRQVFDLNGRTLYDSGFVASSALSVMGREIERPLANGIYLYVDTVSTSDGHVLRKEVKKMVILK